MSDYSDKRVYGLDILRAIAILTVVADHAGYFLNRNLFSYGYLSLVLLDGVTIFFVLSGFLIGGIFLRAVNKPGYNFKELLRFWVRRWFRTLPNYYLVMLVLLPCWYAMGLALPQHLYKYFFFLQNFHDRHPNFFGEVWSLCVEEWFYLLFPISVTISLLVLKIKPRYIILFWVFFFIFSCTGVRFYRLYVHHYYSDQDFNLYIRKQVVTRLDSLMYGIIGAYMVFYHKTIWGKYKMPLFIAGVLLVMSPNLNGFFIKSGFYDRYLAITASSLGTLFLLPQLSAVISGKGFLYAFLTRTSTISYSMYLIHASFLMVVVFPFVCKAVDAVFDSLFLRAFTEYSLFLMATMALSQLLYSFYEHPVMKLRDKVKIG